MSPLTPPPVGTEPFDSSKKDNSGGSILKVGLSINLIDMRCNNVCERSADDHQVRLYESYRRHSANKSNIEIPFFNDAYEN